MRNKCYLNKCRGYSYKLISLGWKKNPLVGKDWLIWKDNKLKNWFVFVPSKSFPSCSSSRELGGLCGSAYRVEELKPTGAGFFHLLFKSRPCEGKNVRHPKKEGREKRLLREEDLASQEEEHWLWKAAEPPTPLCGQVWEHGRAWRRTAVQCPWDRQTDPRSIQQDPQTLWMA